MKRNYETHSLYAAEAESQPGDVLARRGGDP
jgi:hypothetical protein